MGIIQAGIGETTSDKLVSLGSISYQPLLVFYRGAPMELLSGFAGKRLAIGPAGSGSRTFALAFESIQPLTGTVPFASNSKPANGTCRPCRSVQARPT